MPLGDWVLPNVNGTGQPTRRWALARIRVLVFGLALVLVGTASTGAWAQGGTGDDADRDEIPKITEGFVPVLDFLRFIQHHTGKMVNYPSAPTPEAPFQPDVQINVLGDVEPLTYSIAKSILEMNGYELHEDVLEDGSEVINVNHSNRRNRSDIPNPTEIVDSDKPLPPNASNDQLLTMVLQLEFADTNTVIGALRDLLGVAGRGSSGTIQIVNINTTNTLLLKGKKGLLGHVREIVSYIDRDLPPLPQILEVVPVTFADASELSQLISEILNLSTTPGTQNQRNNRQRQRPGGAAAANTANSLQTYTRLVPDTRTQKIVVDSTNEEEVELVMRLIDELDTKVDFHRANTHVYRVKFLKAEDLAEDLSVLVDGANRAGGGGLSNRNRNRRNTGAQGAQAGQQQLLPTRIVPHDETNSLLIQAEPEEYREIINVLHQIDKKRRQVFLEAALVQVNEASTLNYTFEYLAGTLDDNDTRVAALSAFGLTTVDPTQLPNDLARTFLEADTRGILAAVSNDGQLPVIMRALKTDTDSVVVATPFILADDNQTSELDVQTEIFFSTNTLNNNFSTQGQDSEEAGITLTLTPTISEQVVLLDLQLAVSAFAGEPSQSGAVPDKQSNSITSLVTIPDGELFIIGGLSRETDSLSANKIPLLGDLPLIGRFFQDRASSRRRENLYVFLTCHIIREGDILGQLTEQARRDMGTFRDDYKVQTFDPRSLRRNTSPTTQPTGQPGSDPIDDELDRLDREG